jgi:ABC-2 type transport system permease protein
MNLRRVRAVARKELLHIVRDPRSLGLAIGIPMLLLVLFGYALTLDVDNVPLVVWDQSCTADSRDLVSRFSSSRYFSLLRQVDNYRDVLGAIDRGEALAALIVPKDFARDLSAGRDTPVQLIVDGSDSNTATLAIGYAEVVTGTYSQQMSLVQLRRVGAARAEIPLDVEPRVWFNPDLESKNYIVPGLIAVIMMVIAALLTSLTVAREWECGTMEQLISTPVKGHELILGKLLPYFAIGLLDVAVAVLMGQFLFHVPLRGSVSLLFGMSSIFLVGVLAMGMTVSIVAKSQLLASQLAMTLTFLPSFLLSGFMFMIANMPRPLQLVTYLVPARYFVALLKGIYLKGVGLEILAGDALLLVAFGVVMISTAIMKFKKKLA